VEAVTGEADQGQMIVQRMLTELQTLKHARDQSMYFVHSFRRVDDLEAFLRCGELPVS
jgi:trehalose-6-phosphatase